MTTAGFGSIISISGPGNVTVLFSTLRDEAKTDSQLIAKAVFKLPDPPPDVQASSPFQIASTMANGPTDRRVHFS